MQEDQVILELDKILQRLAEFAKTTDAKDTLKNLLPNCQYEQITELLAETECAYTAIIKHGDVPISGLDDISEILKRAKIGALLNAGELLGVVHLMDCSGSVKNYFKMLDSLKIDSTVLSKYYQKLQVIATLKSAITLAIAFDGRVNDSASRELFTIRRNLVSANNRLRSKLNEILQTKSSMFTDNVIVLRNNRFCLPVKIEYKNTFKGIVHDVSSSNTTCYIEPDVCVEIANQIELHLAEERKEIANILQGLSLLVSANYEILNVDFRNLLALDIIFAKGLFARAYDYSLPKVHNEATFTLKKAKHPLISPEKVVPIDVELGQKYDTIIITGPNTGGKTVALKTVGLLHMMVMCGLFVPAKDDSVFGVFKNILVDIDDKQSIEQSLSTFSAHLVKMIEILNAADSESLVLLDELGSGTDPKEGSSLAIAMIDYLRSKGAKAIVTTHYSDLKDYAYNTEGIINASVEFNSTTLLPTYRLLVGVPGKSNAIEIAQRLGLPAKIIQDSRQRLDNNGDLHSQKMYANLEAEILKLRAQEEELQHKIVMYDSLNTKLSNERLKLAKDTDRIMAKAQAEAKDMLENIREEAKELLENLKNTSLKEHEVAEVKYKLKELGQKSIEKSDVNLNFKEQDYVYIKPYEQNGTITKIKKDIITVQFGQFTMDFKAADLLPAQRQEKKVKVQPRMSGYNPKAHVGLSLDLRGKRYEEVKDLLESYLDQAILANLETVTIIHGFGTGAVRNAVREYLKNCPYVKSYRYGQEGEGLNGVTVVNLK